MHFIIRDFWAPFIVTGDGAITLQLREPARIRVLEEFVDKDRIGGDIPSAISANGRLFLSSIGALDTGLGRHFLATSWAEGELI
jgi:hypothetical protein